MYKILKLVRPTNKHHITCILYNSCRYAGHSKWQNIRHIKAKNDAERAAIFSKLRRLMQVSVQGGKSADPSENVQLAHVIEQARKANMPVATINGILKNLKDKSRNADIALKTIELSGPKGCAFIVCVLQGPHIQVKDNISSIIRKSKGAFSIGSIAHLFDCKSIIQTGFPDYSTLEDAVNVAIELEMEDVVQIDEDGQSFLQFTGSPHILNKLKTLLESRNYSVQSAEVNYSPLIQVLVRDDDLNSVNWLYKKLEELPEIVNIFDNIAWPEDL